MDKKPRSLSEREARKRRPRAIATALALALFVVGVYAVSILEWLPRGNM